MDWLDDLAFGLSGYCVCFRLRTNAGVYADDARTPEIQSLSTPLVQYFCICSGGGTLSGRTMRKPTNWASEKYQTLFGNCGSCIFQERSEPRRAALRHMVASSSHEPPRTACGYGLVALFHGSTVPPLLAHCL